MNHSFDIDHAAEYGIPAAVLIDNFAFWIAKNRANEKHQREGRTWSYNSVKAFRELFPYMGIKQIRTALDTLVESGVLLKRDWNEGKADRTLWYAFRDEEAYLGPVGHLPKRANGVPKRDEACAEKGKCTKEPNINTDINTDTAAPTAQSTALSVVVQEQASPIDQVFQYWKQIMKSPRAKLDTKRRTAVQARLKDGYTAADLMQAIDGCSNSDWHMGKNKDGKVFNDLELICRDAGKVDGFMAQTTRAPQSGSASESLQEKNARIMAQVMRGSPDADLRTIDMEA